MFIFTYVNKSKRVYHSPKKKVEKYSFAITSAISLANGQISNIHGSNCKIVVQLTLPKLTSPCFLQLEGTRGVVNDLNIVFEFKKIGIGS